MFDEEEYGRVKLKATVKPSLADIDRKIKDKVAKKQAKVLKKTTEQLAKDLVGDLTNLIDEKTVEEFSEIVTPKIADKKSIFVPDEGLDPSRMPGPQTRFLSASEYEVLYSGGRGSGKSIALIIDPLRYCHKKKFRALIIRKTMPELRELISRAKDLYPQVFPQVKWKEQEKLFEFPSGAKVEFSYCDAVDDAERYRGQEFTWLGIDEITQYNTDEILEKLLRSLRTTDPELTCYLRCTTNPSGAGVTWVKARWIDAGPPDTTITEQYSTPEGDMVTTKKWISSTVLDNPTLIKANPQYLVSLASIKNEALKAQWLYGTWDNIEGLAFSEFKKDKHVISPFNIPRNWHRFRAADWGYSPGKAVCLWFARDPNTGTIYIYRELAVNGKDVPVADRFTADKFALKILELEGNEFIEFGVLDGSTWAERGQVGETVADTMLNMGCSWTPADRSKGSRVAGKNMMHSYLQYSEDSPPRIQIFNTCTQLIKELSSLELDPNDKEDVNTKQEDHAWDACRYGLLTQPTVFNGSDPFDSRYEQKPILINRKYGF